MDHDVIIIGAGMSGLAAGIRLAHYDLKVLILEKHYLWGGLNSFYRMKGYRFDVGLHAMTNYVPRGVRNAPLPKLLRQLRIPYEAFDLHEQGHSEIRFLDRRLRFTNDFQVLFQEVVAVFPHQADGFRNLVRAVEEFDELDLSYEPVAARSVLEAHLSDPVLVDMLLCPLMYYGSAREDDMDWDQFVVMFKSIYKEGFARPYRGVRQILEVLIARFKELGGTLRLKTGVASLSTDHGRVREVVLENGERLRADRIISSAGLLETMRMVEGFDPEAVDLPREKGNLSFMESISVLDREPRDLGFDATIVFFNNGERFRYRKPASLIDPSSGVICCPNNYRFDRPLDDSLMRVTNLANYDLWTSMTDDAYRAAKKECFDASVEAIRPYVPDFRGHMVFNDTFTPRTIKHYTGHLHGAVYGAPRKVKDGRTHLENLFLCGTDQGFLGIVGAMLSGITVANLHVLKRT